MLVEYLLLLAISVVIILAPFMSNKGPVTMMSKSAPNLAREVEKALVTGEGFFTRNGRRIDWQRR